MELHVEKPMSEAGGHEADIVVSMADLPADRHETLAERLIREAMEAGEFDDLPGTGKPLPGAGVSDDDLWWVREWLRRNREEDSG
jgi:hypothetical protein